MQVLHIPSPRQPVRSHLYAVLGVAVVAFLALAPTALAQQQEWPDEDAFDESLADPEDVVLEEPGGLANMLDADRDVVVVTAQKPLDTPYQLMQELIRSDRCGNDYVSPVRGNACAIVVYCARAENDPLPDGQKCPADQRKLRPVFLVVGYRPPPPPADPYEASRPTAAGLANAFTFGSATERRLGLYAVKDILQPRAEAGIAHKTVMVIGEEEMKPLHCSQTKTTECIDPKAFNYLSWTVMKKDGSQEQQRLPKDFVDFLWPTDTLMDKFVAANLQRSLAAVAEQP